MSALKVYTEDGDPLKDLKDFGSNKPFYLHDQLAHIWYQCQIKPGNENTQMRQASFDELPPKLKAIVLLTT